jgi:hypothetical protein
VSLPVLAAACTRAGGEAGSPWNGDP